MKRLIFIYLTLTATIIYAQDRDLFSIGSLSADPGEKVSGKLIIMEGIDKGTFVPVSIIHGSKPGPVLTLNAGLHGTEYVPVVVLQKLLKEIEPEDLSGTLVLIHIANIPGFKEYVAYNNPVDKKNPNRTYPGKMEGTISERIAYAITHEIIAKSNYYIDLHGGEFSEQLVDYIYFVTDSPDKELNETNRMLAHATGNHYLIPDMYLSPEETKGGTYSELAAIYLGIPAVSLEFGDQGKVEDEIVEFAVKGMKNVLRTIGMIEGKPFVNEHPVYLIEDHEVICKVDGILYTEVNKEQFVSKGKRLGYTTDYWGNLLEEYHAPVSGIVVLAVDVPATHKGKKVFRVSKFTDTLD